MRCRFVQHDHTTMEKFELILENKKRASYHSLALFLIVLNIAVFASLAAYTADTWVFRKSIAGIIVIGLLFTVALYARNKKKETSTAAHAGLLCIVFTWISLMYWWAAAACLLFWLLYFISRQPLVVSFSEKTISYPSFPRRNLDWKELSNTILKDDLLTIDFKNNRIVQQLIEKTAKTVNEKEFNDFCRTQLRKQ